MAKSEGAFSLNEFYDEQARGGVPIPPEITTIARYIDEMQARGLKVSYMVAYRRLEQSARDGKLVFLGLVYDSKTCRNVRAWKLADNGKAKPKQPKGASKTNRRAP